jgi:hypothetical protein
MSRGKSNNNDNKRTRARLQLPALMKQTGGRCHWCGEAITMLRTIEEHEIVRLTSRSVWWRDVDGTELCALIASVDHVKPLEHGGKNYGRNLVACCTGCNGRRSREPGSTNYERNAARERAEREEAEAVRPLFKWLRRVGGTLRFGKEVRCFVEEDGKVVADYKHTDIVKAVKETQKRYNQLVMDRLGKGKPVGTGPHLDGPAIDA